MATGVFHDRPATTVLSPSAVRELLADRPAPCLSLYMPTHRTVPDNRVDVPVYRRLVGSLEVALAPVLRRAAIDRLLEPVRALGDDVRFWRHAREGLAVLAATDFCRVFHLPVRPAPVVHVGNRFHTVPLVRLVADSDRFHALVLTSRAATAYEGRLREGSVDALDVVPLGVDGEPGVLRRDDVVDAESREPHRVQRGLGPAGLGAGGVVHGGAGSKRDATATDTEIFLRRVDAAVFDGLSAPAGLPLVLVALPRLAAEFRRLSRNHLLLDEIVPRDVHLAPARDVAADVAAVVGRARARRIDHDLDRFAAARGRGMAAADLTDIARAAVAGHVGLLLIERDRFEPGLLDRAAGAIAFAAARPAEPARGGMSPAAGAEDIIGAIAETVILHGGTVLAVDRGRMPTESGAAAIYRHP